eukprot:TRINITY_DN121038_c0_g1_i1.p1 TRINITY_DN121038_c0_g1~~TRINITY_DN121038_c0_g1_i1.p1  ORF type:complete len:531 (-),score=172.61 TRINITY_DN121038_c0_g1_i1:68-1660(-)
MSYSVLEQLRSAHEDIENLEKAMSMIMMDKAKNNKPGVSCEHALKYLIDSSQLKAKTALEIYQDKDGMRADDIASLAGQRGGKSGDVWTSFYDKVKEVKDYHRRFGVNSTFPELQNTEWFYTRAYESDRTDKIFTGEEDMGKRVDMNRHYDTYVNIKPLTAHRKKRFREQTFARLKRKTPDLEPNDEIVEQTFEKEYVELDYISWLKTFDQFHELPRHLKYKSAKWKQYLNDIAGYLKDFLLRCQPVIDVAKLEAQFEKEFEQRWEAKNIPGWQEPSHKDKFFSLPTNHLAANENTLKAHQTGKVYKKKVEEMQKMSFDEQKKLVTDSEAEDKNVARLESRVGKWHDLLSDTLTETVTHLQKKQSQTADEMQAEKGGDDDSDMEDMDDGGVDVSDGEMADVEDRPIYNPLNLPLGWDGKPIPFWLYKLHGLGIEYKCEICGNYSYWGRRAFERHFSEWRHAFGMRCLKIPNTAHFKEITNIEDAITLYEKLKRDAEDQTFRPDADVECEDIQGNVMSQKAFEDLRRQGLV